MPAYQSIADIVTQNRQDHTAIVQHVEQVLIELESIGRALKAVTHIDTDFSMSQANALADTQTNKPLSSQPLYGVPLAHKELYGRQIEGRESWPDEGGSQSYAGRKARQTATVINKLDAAGAVDCGRLVSVEYALGVTGHNAYAGTPQNPWNRDYICGGSSSGSGAVVAAGIIPGALGSDTGGSVRLPAAACGLVGIKPTHGLISRTGVFPLSNSLDTVGTLTRSVADGAAILSVITGYDDQDNLSIDIPDINYGIGIDEGISGLRIGLPSHYFLSECDTVIADKIAASFDLCSSLGAKCRDITIAGIENTNPLNILLIASEAANIHKDILYQAHDQLNDQTLMRILTGIFSDEAAYHHLQACRADYIARTLPDLFDQVDMFMTPVWPFMLPTITDSDVGANPDAAPLMLKIGHNTRPINFLGLPAICLPIGLDAHGLPISVQLVGKPFSESALIKAAYTLEREYRFWDQRPAAIRDDLRSSNEFLQL